MIKTEPLMRILEIVLASAYIKNEKPLSCIFVANPECGKTTIIRKYCLKTEGIFYTTDATAFGIIRDTDNLREIEEGKIKHIVIPDLLSCLARKESTVQSFIQFMNSAIEEGVVNISTYATKIKQGDKRKAEISVGLITSITSEVFRDKRRGWNKIGFLSRVLPITYDYDITTRIEILDSIEKQEHLKEIIQKLKFNKRPREISLSNEKAKEIEPYTLALSQASNLYGFRMQKQFQTFCKSIAYLDEENEVKDKHINEFKQLCRYINLEHNKI